MHFRFPATLGIHTGDFLLQLPEMFILTYTRLTVRGTSLSLAATSCMFLTPAECLRLPDGIGTNGDFTEGPQIKSPSVPV